LGARQATTHENNIHNIYVYFGLAIFVFVVFELGFYFLDIYGDDSPGFGVVVVYYGKLPCLLAVLAWLAYALRAALQRNWWAASSRLFGPLVGVLASVLISLSGVPPWRFAFKIMRPVYMYEVWRTAPDASGRKQLALLTLDRERWQGHETRKITYSREGTATSGLSRERTLENGCIWTQRIGLGLGFQAEEVIENYVEPCPP